MPRERRKIVLDGDINWKLSLELRRRGRRDATAVRPLGFEDLKDAALFKALAADHEPFVLVTWDNRMPRVHAAELEHHGTTLAVVDSAARLRTELSEEHYYRDVVHRWLHIIERQAAGSCRTYRLSSHRSGPPRLR